MLYICYVLSLRILCNLHLSSCGWLSGLSLLHGMGSAALRPTAVSFTAALSACDKAQRWAVALALPKTNAVALNAAPCRDIDVYTKSSWKQSYAYVYIWRYVCMHVDMYVDMYGCMFRCIYLCMVCWTSF